MVGTVTLSVEIELAWGVHHLPDPDRLDRFSEGRVRETETLGRLLEVCDDLDVPISFDVVGHLLLDACPGEHDGPHREGWFAADPGSDPDTDPLFYAPDLVDRVRRAEVDHEVCTHTFSHVRCDVVEPTVVAWELDAVRDAHREFGLDPPRSFVPPIHGPPPRDVLARNGVRTVRVPTTLEPPVGTPDPPAGRVRRAARALERSHPAQVLLRTHPVREPRVREGVVESYTTWHASLSAPFLPSGRRPPHRAYRLLPLSLRQRLHGRYLRTGVEAAIRQDSHAHFWTHLYDVSNDAQWPVVSAFLHELAGQRDSGTVSIETMEAVGDGVG